MARRPPDETMECLNPSVSTRHCYRVILFDFDYTLADSSRGIVDCANFALKRLGLALASEEAICQSIGLSLSESFVQLAGPDNRALSRDYIRLFMHRADEVMASLTTIYDVVPVTVRILKQQGIRLGIVSTKYRYRIEAMLSRAGLREPFDVIVGGEDVARHKPEPDSLLMAMERLAARPEQVLYVGDSTVDAEAARRAGVSFVAVLSGVTPRSAFAGYPVAAILNRVDELIPLWSAPSGLTLMEVHEP